MTSTCWIAYLLQYLAGSYSLFYPPPHSLSTPLAPLDLPKLMRPIALEGSSPRRFDTISSGTSPRLSGRLNRHFGTPCRLWLSRYCAAWKSIRKEGV
ncbi:hypothetical protein RTBOTA2_000735 [Rhodotorula toruloides]|nr:hypothetical protein RTBOTA2_000735 [Rhodotorula toruloides]